MDRRSVLKMRGTLSAIAVLSPDKDGYLRVSDKPGLGIELNEDVCKKHLSKGSSFFK